MEQWQASNLNPVGLTEVFKAIPISKTAKRKVNKIEELQSLIGRTSGSLKISTLSL